MPSSSNHSRLVEYCCASLAKSKLRALPIQRPTSASAARSASPPVDSRESGSDPDEERAGERDDDEERRQHD